MTECVDAAGGRSGIRFEDHIRGAGSRRKDRDQPLPRPCTTGLKGGATPPHAPPVLVLALPSDIPALHAGMALNWRIADIIHVDSIWLYSAPATGYLGTSVAIESNQGVGALVAHTGRCVAVQKSALHGQEPSFDQILHPGIRNTLSVLLPGRKK